MSNDTPDRDDELHELLGAFVLGGLEPEEHQAFTRHLRTCPACQGEAAQFSGLPALLDLASPDATAPAPPDLTATARAEQPVPVALLEKVRSRRRSQRWRLGAAAAILALVAGGVGYGLWPVVEHLNAPTSSHVVASPAPASDAAVEIDLVNRGWGTQMDLVGTNLPKTGVLYLNVTGADGRSYDVASWSGTPSGRTTLTAACWMKATDIKTIEVRTQDGTAVATATV